MDRVDDHRRGLVGCRTAPHLRDAEADRLEIDRNRMMAQRSTWTAPILSFDGSHTRAQHTARSALLTALRELPTATFTTIAETPRKRYSPARDEATCIQAEHLILSMSRHVELTEN